jgi:hypothetical protein
VAATPSVKEMVSPALSVRTSVLPALLKAPWLQRMSSPSWVLGRVGRELDGVVVRRARELADVLEGGRGGAVDGADVEEVVGGRHLGDGCEGEGRGLHGDLVYLEKRGWLRREGEAKKEENWGESERMIRG